jgi:hypothetical protein
MSWVAAAVVGGSIIGGVVSGAGAQSAANTQAGADNNATQAQLSMFNTIQGQEQPFMTAGVNATTGLSQLLGQTSGTSNTGGLANGYLTQTMGPMGALPQFNPSSVTSSPGYQFAQQQGLSQVANNEAPNVGALSGAALKALTNFSTGTAEQYYNDYFNQNLNQNNQTISAYNTNLNSLESQQNNIFSRLSGIAGLGQNAASNTGTAGTSLGTGAAQSTAAAGAASAAGTVGAANAIGSGVSNAGTGYALSSILNNNSTAANPSYGTTAAGNTNYFTTGS